MNRVYLGLSGNIGDTISVFEQTVVEIASLAGVFDLSVSPFYLTTPVDAPNQNDYINAVCNFDTSLSVNSLWEKLQQIETTQGKSAKPKNAPRIIDIDILFFGSLLLTDSDLEIPHPRWSQRLFVLIPLLNLTSHLEIPFGPHQKVQRIDIQELIDSFPKDNSQYVSLVEKKRAFKI